jgi:hypothetical protein
MRGSHVTTTFPLEQVMLRNEGHALLEAMLRNCTQKKEANCISNKACCLYVGYPNPHVTW